MEDTTEKRPVINNKAKLKQKCFQMQKNLPWQGTLDIAYDPELKIEDLNNDFDREAVFYKQAFDAVHKAIPKLEEAKIPIFRPDDYFAEMSKSDSHMQRVRQKLLDIQKDKERHENARRLREEKKFAQKSQTAALLQKQANKRKLAEAVKSHRKGMKAQLETMLNNASKLEDEEREDDAKAKFAGKKVSRGQRNKKFGYGGQKKRSKKNDLESLNSVYKPKKGGIRKKGR